MKSMKNLSKSSLYIWQEPNSELFEITFIGPILKSAVRLQLLNRTYSNFPSKCKLKSPTYFRCLLKIALVSLLKNKKVKVR
jgi:hypothetical protein